MTPGRGSHTRSTFSGWRDASDVPQKGVGDNSVPGEVPDIGES